MEYDFLIVGAGLSGSVLAERLASQLNQKVLLVEKRNHIGGNVYDEYDGAGILVGKYGPHTFHTNDDDVFDYVLNFTKWHVYEHKVVSFVDGKYVPFPIGIETLNALYNENFTVDEFDAYIQKRKIRIDEIKTSEDVVLSQAGKELYEKFFKNYTFKQWGVYPSELDSTVISRIPFRRNNDIRYFTDKYQGNPVGGYTNMIKNMLDHPMITIMLNTDYKDVIDKVDYKKMIYTGPIDYYFNYKYGRLRYRSAKMVFETYDQIEYSPYVSIRFPNDYEYTRITEFKKMTGQKNSKTTILKEYPCDEGEPYYPFPNDHWNNLAAKYRDDVLKEKDVYFTGRLAEYRYHDMDDVIKKSLDLYEEIRGQYEDTSHK